MALPSLDEDPDLLAAAASLARALAARLCGAKLGRDSCAALHGVWPDLRRLGLAATPHRHGAFFTRALVRGGDGPRRVLVSAAADSGMLELVVAAHRAAGRAVAPTVLDQCPTPLLLCAWYGARVGVPVRTVASDLLAWREPAAYDLVCTHSLLRSFPRAVQGEAVARWRELLRPGGALVTVTRVDPEGAADAGPAPAQVEDFAARVEDFAARVEDLAARVEDFAARVEAEARRRAAELPDLDVATIGARARRFAAGAMGHPIGPASALVALVEEAGLAVEELTVRRLAGPAGAATAPGAARTADYAELVAVRP